MTDTWREDGRLEDLSLALIYNDIKSIFIFMQQKLEPVRDKSLRNRAGFFNWDLEKKSLY